MSDWNTGYIADIGYTYGYYAELNPLRLKLAFLNKGIALSGSGTACELGFGQGLSINIHAAASATSWYGTDINPSHAGFARELARIADTDVRLYDDSFAEFAARPDLPDFDFIGMHGIWSWISDENRSVIVDFIRRKLKIGGVLYISYNTLPGWAAFSPLRQLMTMHSSMSGSRKQDIVHRVEDALEFAEKLLATNPLYSRANPLAGELLKKIKKENRIYLAHEFFNSDWHPMHFATTAELLEPAKLQYVCSASYLDQIDAMHLTEEQISFLQEIHDPMFRENVRDVMVNNRFRRDYWVKGIRKMDQFDQAEKIRQQKIILVTRRPDVSLKVHSVLGEAILNEDVYLPILDFLADLTPKTIGDIEQAVKPKKVRFSQVIHAVLVIAAKGHIFAVQGNEEISHVKDQCDRLNAHLLVKARSSSDIGYLASPVTGGGIPVGRFQQLFLLAIREGMQEPSDWVQFTWQILFAQGQKFVKKGKTLETPEENIAELTALAKTFMKKQLPALKALQVT
ncbi:MAG: class I SAM-dependent methyltransferase [Chlorobiales bacterium]|nr:class I SAM-dependent methyltransferase [Chlorobiales bacterium]